MKRKVAIVTTVLVAVLITIIAVVNNARQGRGPEATDSVIGIENDGRALYEKARGLAQNSEFPEALALYKEILIDFPESSFAEEARREMENTNMDILFSKRPTEDSLFYEVQAGDNLSKIARKHGTTVGLLRRTNGIEGDAIWPGQRLKIYTSKFSILVDKSQSILMLKADDEVIKTYTVSTGVDNCTPVGEFTINTKLVDPTWYRTGAVVASGSPDNLLGTRWLGITTQGYGIHGNNDESTIGRQITAGCVRMRNSEVEELYDIVPIGTQVIIRE